MKWSFYFKNVENSKNTNILIIRTVYMVRSLVNDVNKMHPHTSDCSPTNYDKYNRSSRVVVHKYHTGRPYKM